MSKEKIEVSPPFCNPTPQESLLELEALTKEEKAWKRERHTLEELKENHEAFTKVRFM